jgi:outer membrane protein OmpA-like peptidoglycan-associated protein
VSGAAHRLGFALALIVLGGVGCAGAELATRAGKVRDALADARARGAYRCAPRALARGEVNVDFAERELGKGEYFAARGYLETAQVAADEALRLSNDERGCPKAKAPPPRRPEPMPDPLADADGDGIPDLRDRCPQEAEDKDGFQDDDGCPDLDNDGDGIVDAKDGCPNEPEDGDGFEDEDGCPDADNDKDTVLDALDRCPNEAGLPSEGGCPKPYEHIRVTEEKIELGQAIFFQSGKSAIMPRSFALLDEVAAVLSARPSMQVRVEGHTDGRGSRSLNLRLSQARAEAVQGYLVGKGIGSDRMEAKGYGPEQPIDDNKTATGRERNRRVEFMITQQ